MRSVFGKKRATIFCGVCGRRMHKDLHFVISVMHDPKAAEQLRNGRLFEVTCPTCGEFDLATYRNIYHDEYHKLLIFSEPPRNQKIAEAISLLKQTRITGLYADLGNVIFWPKTKPLVPLNDHVMRVVTHPDPQAEKARIYWDDLDDRIIELMKAELFRQYCARHELQGTSTVFYSGIDDKGLRFYIEVEQEYQWVSPSVYKKMEQFFDLSAIGQPDNYIVDIDWAYRTLNS